jgi:uncharacterized membrane protein
VGQATFAYYIIAFYGPSVFSGNFEAWSKNTILIKGYVAGDLVGNLAFLTHALIAAMFLASGALQLVPQIRARAIVFHRWNGRLYLAAAGALALGGLGMVWLRDAGGGIIGSISVSLNAALILTFGTLAWRAARRRDIAVHRRWAMRTFMVANGVFWLRLLFPGWVVLTRTPPSETLFHVFSFASYLLPLAVLEIFLLAKDKGGPLAKFSTAGLLVACAAYMGVGVLGFYFIFVQRFLA